MSRCLIINLHIIEVIYPNDLIAILHWSMAGDLQKCGVRSPTNLVLLLFDQVHPSMHDPNDE
jgi:hypothetical protein